jgi:hypothetical protein
MIIGNPKWTSRVESDAPGVNQVCICVGSDTRKVRHQVALHVDILSRSGATAQQGNHETGRDLRPKKGRARPAFLASMEQSREGWNKKKMVIV